MTSVVAVARLELVELAAVDDARDHLAHVVGLPDVGVDDAVDVLGRKPRRNRLAHLQRDALRPVEVADDPARDRQRMVIVERVVVGDAGHARVDVGAAQLLGRHDLAGRRLHERRTAEEDRPLLLDDDRLVGHRRDVRSAGRARAHHHGDLRNALRRHRRLVVEDAAEVIAVGKHVDLVGQVGAAGIDEVDARQVVLARDLLRAQVLLDGQRIVGAALDGRVVADDHALAAGDPADAGDDARRPRWCRRTSRRQRAARTRGTASRDRPARARARAAAACRARRASRTRPRRRPARSRRPSPGGRRRAPPSHRGSSRTSRRAGRAWFR